MIFTDDQYTRIGKLLVAEMDRNRHFRREIERLPLGGYVITILSEDIQIEQPKKRNWFQRLVDLFKAWNNKN